MFFNYKFIFGNVKLHDFHGNLLGNLKTFCDFFIFLIVSFKYINIQIIFLLYLTIPR